MTMRETIARAIDPPTFEQPRINLFKPDYDRAYAQADRVLAALSTLTDEMVERGAKAMRDRPALDSEPDSLRRTLDARACLTEANRAAKGE